MVVQTSGELLLRLMRLERSRTVDTEWLLHGPTDPAVVLPFRARQGDPAHPSGALDVLDRARLARADGPT